MVPRLCSALARHIDWQPLVELLGPRFLMEHVAVARARGLPGRANAERERPSQGGRLRAAVHLAELKMEPKRHTRRPHVAAWQSASACARSAEPKSEIRAATSAVGASPNDRRRRETRQGGRRRTVSSRRELLAKGPRSDRCFPISLVASYSCVEFGCCVRECACFGAKHAMMGGCVRSKEHTNMIFVKSVSCVCCEWGKRLGTNGHRYTVYQSTLCKTTVRECASTHDG